MNAIRLILLIIIGWILWVFWRRWYQNNLKQDKNQTRNVPTGPKSSVMVQCDYCGLYLPIVEAETKGTESYCCQAHKQAAQSHDN
jgi:hypothetical protein